MMTMYPPWPSRWSWKKCPRQQGNKNNCCSTISRCHVHDDLLLVVIDGSNNVWYSWCHGIVGLVVVNFKSAPIVPVEFRTSTVLFTIETIITGSRSSMITRNSFYLHFACIASSFINNISFYIKSCLLLLLTFLFFLCHSSIIYILIRIQRLIKLCFEIVVYLHKKKGNIQRMNLDTARSVVATRAFRDFKSLTA